MAMKSKEEILAELKAVIGDNTDDAVITVLEDVSDTMDAYAEAEDWRAKYDALNEEWRQKYIARFYDVAEVADKMADVVEEEIDEEEQVKTIEELFKTEEE